MIKRWGWFCVGATAGISTILCILLGFLTGQLIKGEIIGVSILPLWFFVWKLFDDFLTKRSNGEKTN